MMPISQLIQNQLIQNQPIQKSVLRALSMTLLNSLLIAAPLLTAQKTAHHAAAQADTTGSQLVQAVREGTRKYIDVNEATADGYGPFLGCVAGTDHGAMGVHYVNGAALTGLTLDPAKPQALIYEPFEGKMRFVGVEFIIDSASWQAAAGNPNAPPPVLDGHVFNFVAAPNRFNINSFYELHVWAWRDNPQGAFVDWNNHVTCSAE